MFGGGDSGVRPDCRAVPAWLALLSEASRQRTTRHRPGTQGGLSSYYYLIPSGETRGRTGALYPCHHTTTSFPQWRPGVEQVLCTPVIIQLPHSLSGDPG